MNCGYLCVLLGCIVALLVSGAAFLWSCHDKGAFYYWDSIAIVLSRNRASLHKICTSVAIVPRLLSAVSVGYITGAIRYKFTSM